MSRSPLKCAEISDAVARPRRLEQRRYLRSLLVDQLTAFECGGLQLHSGQANVSTQAMAQVRSSIREFDVLIAAELEGAA